MEKMLLFWTMGPRSHLHLPIQSLTDLLIHYFGNSQVFENLGLARLWALGSMYLLRCSETAWQSRMSSELGPRDTCSCLNFATYCLDLIYHIRKNEARDAVPFDLTSTEM